MVAKLNGDEPLYVIVPIVTPTPTAETDVSRVVPPSNAFTVKDVGVAGLEPA